MSQLTLGLTSGLGIWTIGMGAAAATGGFWGSGTKLEMISFSSSNIKLSSLDALMQTYKEFWCINKLFKEINWNTTGIQETDALTNNEAKGCLSVWWEKEIYDEERWQGSWNLLWIMKDNNKGRILLYKVETKNGSLSRESSFFSIKKKEDGKDEWLAQTTRSTYNESNSITPNEKLINKSNGWDFETSTDKICSSSNKCESEAPKRTFVNLNWDFVSGKKSETDQEYSIHDWIQNIDKLTKGSDVKSKLTQIKGYFRLS